MQTGKRSRHRPALWLQGHPLVVLLWSLAQPSERSVTEWKDPSVKVRVSLMGIL